MSPDPLTPPKESAISARYASREAYIYALRDRSGLVRYVGKANDIQKRLASHIRDSRRRNTPVYCWIRKCISSGTIPTIETIEVCANDKWEERERYWVSHYRAIGPLLNVSDGGDEPHCEYSVRAENGRAVARARCDSAEKKRIYDLKRNICGALKRGECTEAQKEKFRQAMIKAPKIFGCFGKWL